MLATCIETIKDVCEVTIPAENWANKGLIQQDIDNNVPIKQRIKYAEQGKYKLENNFSKPHRDPKTGKIIIENSLLYKEDCEKYGSNQAYKWLYQGKYNLSSEELKKEEERIKEEWDNLYSLLR